MASILVEVFRHNLWANLRLLDLCAGLPDELLDASAPGTYGRVRPRVQGDGAPVAWSAAWSFRTH